MRMPKLSTHNTSFNRSPSIITDCAPRSIIADLHTTLQVGNASNQPHITSRARRLTCCIKVSECTNIAQSYCRCIDSLCIFIA